MHFNYETEDDRDVTGEHVAESVYEMWTDPTRRSGLTDVEEIPTVYIVDDDAEARDQVRALANTLGYRTELFLTASSFLRSIDPDRVGCLVLDARLEDMSGIELLRELAARKLSIPVIVTTGYLDARMIIEMMKTGAFDVVEKPFKHDRLEDSIRQAIAKHIDVRRSQVKSREIRRRYAHLTPRERQVLELVAAGLSTKAIAIRLGLQEKTIEAYRWRIKGTMEARNAADLVRMINMISDEK